MTIDNRRGRMAALAGTSGRKGAMIVGRHGFWLLVYVAAGVAGLGAAAVSASPTRTHVPLLVAFSSKTGAPLLPLPQVQRGGAIEAIADDGRGGWYVGGSFSSIGGIGCANLVHIGADRRVDRSWCPRPTNHVRALLRVGTRLFVGGEHYAGEPRARIAGRLRANLAAFDTRSGRLLPWNPGAVSVNEHNGYGGVSQLAVSRDGRWLYVNGIFNRLGGSARHNFAAVGVRTGRASGFRPDPLENIHDDCVLAFAVTRTRVYATGGYTKIGGASTKSLGEWDALDAHSGKLLARARHSGPLAMIVVGDIVYGGGPFDARSGAAHSSLDAFDGATGAATGWAPHIAANLGHEALTVSGSRLIATLTRDHWEEGPRRLAAYDLDSAKLLWQRQLPSSGWTAIASNAATVVVVGA